MIYKNIPGWFSDSEANTLYNLTLQTRGNILEIGHFYGRSTSTICEAIKHKEEKNKFISYDIGFTTPEEVRSFYSNVMNYDKKDGFVPPLYTESFTRKVLTTDIAKENLKKYNLDIYVDLISGNFIDLDNEKYTLIFCDATHDDKEVRINLPHIINRSLKDCIWAFHDMSDDLIKLVQNISYCQFLFKKDSLGVFKFIGN